MTEAYEEKFAIMCDVVKRARFLSRQNPSIDDYHIREYEQSFTYKERDIDPIVDETSFLLGETLLYAVQEGRFTDYIALRYNLVGKRDSRDEDGDLNRNLIPLNIAMVIEKKLVQEGVIDKRIFMSAYGLDDTSYDEITSLVGRWPIAE